MRGTERREQLIEVARRLFAEKGFEGTSVEEIAARAEVSKPVVYEHFGGKEGLYAVVVDREVGYLLATIESALADASRSRELVEQAALALLDYVETHTDGFRILVRDSSVASSSGSFASLLSDVATQVEGLLVTEFKRHGLEAKTAPMYAQMLVGMTALTGQWWLEHAQAEEVGGGRPPGEPGLERLGPSGPETSAGHRGLTERPGRQRLRPSRLVTYASSRTIQ